MNTFHFTSRVKEFLFNQKMLSSPGQKIDKKKVDAADNSSVVHVISSK